MTLVSVRLPGSSRPLMVENVAWGGYNRSASQRTCSEPFGNAFRAGDPRGGSNMLFGNIEGSFTERSHCSCSEAVHSCSVREGG